MTFFCIVVRAKIDMQDFDAVLRQFCQKFLCVCRIILHGDNSVMDDILIGHNDDLIAAFQQLFHSVNSAGKELRVFDISPLFIGVIPVDGAVSVQKGDFLHAPGFNRTWRSRSCGR